MSFITSMFSTPSAPALSVVTPAKAAPKETDADIIKERQGFYARQLAANQKNTQIGTNPLGVASDVLQTSRKALLGGT
jgi:hypothetical protein